MALSEQTLDHLLEAEGNIRSAIKCAAVNENPLVVTQTVSYTHLRAHET